MSCGYRLIDHTADLGIAVWGQSAAQVFERAAMALVDLLFIKAAVTPDRTEAIDVEGLDWSDLMVNWLREVLYLWVGRHRVVGCVHVDALSATRLRATVSSSIYNPGRHHCHHEIKAVTYHRIEVGPDDKGWRAQVIFDV
jgi:SHS2 domain-containing protein